MSNPLPLSSFDRGRLFALALSEDLIELSSPMDGHWITIDGSHVFIRDGKIAKGPAALIGMKHAEAELSHRGTATGSFRQKIKEDGSYVTDQGHQFSVTGGKISHGPMELVGKDANDYGTHGSKVKKLLGANHDEAMKIAKDAAEWHKTKEALKERATRKPSGAMAAGRASAKEVNPPPGHPGRVGEENPANAVVPHDEPMDFDMMGSSPEPTKPVGPETHHITHEAFAKYAQPTGGVDAQGRDTYHYSTGGDGNRRGNPKEWAVKSKSATHVQLETSRAITSPAKMDLEGASAMGEGRGQSEMEKMRAELKGGAMEAGRAAVQSAVQKDLFGKSFIASSGIGGQSPMFHEPVKVAVPTGEAIKGSKNALDPKNTAEMFATPTKSEGHLGFFNKDGQKHELYRDSFMTLHSAPASAPIDSRTRTRVPTKMESPMNSSAARVEELLGSEHPQSATYLHAHRADNINASTMASMTGASAEIDRRKQIADLMAAKANPTHHLVADPIAKGKGFTRKQVEQKLIEHHNATNNDSQNAIHMERKIRDAAGSGDPYTFHKKLPTEIKEFMAGRPELRSMFSVSKDAGQAGGADAFGEHGDAYLEHVERLAGSPLKAALKTAKLSQDPAMNFTAMVHENMPTLKGNKEGTRVKTKLDTVNAKDLDVGHAFTYGGHEFRVVGQRGASESDDTMHKVLRGAGQEFPLEALHGTPIPIDHGSLKGKKKIDPLQHGGDSFAPFSRARDAGRMYALSMN